MPICLQAYTFVVAASPCSHRRTPRTPSSARTRCASVSILNPNRHNNLKLPTSVCIMNPTWYNNLKLRYFVLLMVVLIPLCWLGISNHGFWGTDEPRVAEIGREMALTGNLAVPTLNQKPFLEQPPLYYAALAATFKIFGVSDRVARVPSALFAMGGAVALFFLGAMLFGPRAGFLSSFIMATSFEYFQIGHWVLVDSALTCFVVWAMALFMAGYTSGENREKLLYYSLFYLSCTLAFYSKGFIGVVIPGLGIAALPCIRKEPERTTEDACLAGHSHLRRSGSALVLGLMASGWARVPQSGSGGKSS